MKRLHVLLVCVSALLPAVAQAASGDVATGTGSLPPPPPPVITFTGALLEEKIVMLKELLGERPMLTRDQLTPLAKKRELLASERARYRERRAEFLAECRGQLRKANRDQLFPVSLRCYRGILLQDMTYLRKREDVVAGTVGVSEAAKTAAIATVRELTDAIVIVLNAIDTGVYENIADLQDVKQRLHAQYRLPDYLADILLKADRYKGWTVLLLANVEQLLAHETQHAANVREQAEKVVTCLWNHTHMLDDIARTLPADTLQGAMLLQTYEQATPTCLAPRGEITDMLIEEKNPPKSQ